MTSFVTRSAEGTSALIRELISLPLLVVAFLLQAFQGKNEPVIQKGKLVLLIHGYVGLSSHFSYIKHHLKKNGFAVFTIDLGNPFLSIDSYAEKVRLKVEEIQRNNPRKITLVGHSMGGIVAARYAANCKNADHIAQIITLGSPLQGTRLAHIGYGECTNQMIPDSPYLKQLEKDLSDTNIPFYNLGSRSDLIVIPNTSSSFKTIPHGKKIFGGMGHHVYLFSDDVINFLIKII